MHPRPGAAVPSISHAVLVDSPLPDFALFFAKTLARSVKCEIVERAWKAGVEVGKILRREKAVLRLQPPLAHVTPFTLFCGAIGLLLPRSFQIWAFQGLRGIC